MSFWLGPGLLFALLLAWHGAIVKAGDTFLFREPRLSAYEISKPDLLTPQSVRGTNSWVTAVARGTTNRVQFGSRVLLQLADPNTLSLFATNPLAQLSRTLPNGVFIFQCPTPEAAVAEAQRFAATPGVLASYPILRRPKGVHSVYAADPSDPYFPQQWYLENRASNGTPLGVDLNVRAAWPLSRGAGVLVAVADTGIEMSHPDLASAFQGQPHFNFYNGTTTAVPVDDLATPTSPANHGTCSAGLLGARLNNRRGLAGVAPESKMASWVVVGLRVDLSDEGFMDMFQYKSDLVSVQNHSWGNLSGGQIPLSILESIGISNAVHRGRSGLGVVMIRAGGNDKGLIHDVDDQEEIAIPDVIAVGAVRRDGRVASYSNRGAALLVAAPSGDQSEGFTNVVSTDRLGIFGYNGDTSANDDSADYATGTNGFSGTSASAPLVSGVAALMLSANPKLSIRDLQQILILSARHFDLLDHDLSTNGAGLRVSHNLGFGVPDAAEAVRLAKIWKPRPAFNRITRQSTLITPIPEVPLLEIEGNTVPFNLKAPAVWAGFGPEPIQPSDLVPIVDSGLGNTNFSGDLRGKAALILRGDTFFYEKIARAAELGARFAIIRNNRDIDDLIVMGQTESTPIPAVFLGQRDGETLNSLVLNPLLPVRARLNFNADARAAVYSFQVTDQLICEHVGLRLSTDHPRRSDLRIVLQSPAGTRSILQRKNLDDTPGPVDWTYFSTHHFLESSVGTWKLFVLDQSSGFTGTIRLAELSIRGVPITDSDHDGLDDQWEMKHFNNLRFVATDDPDHDGYSNAREQIMGTDPNLPIDGISLDLSGVRSGSARLSWAGQVGQKYDVYSSPALGLPFNLITNVAGSFPETELFLPSNSKEQLYKLIRH